MPLLDSTPEPSLHQLAGDDASSTSVTPHKPSDDVDQQIASSQGSKSEKSCMLQMFLWVIWFATCHKPLRISAIDTPFRRLPMHEDIPPLSEISWLLVWLANGEIWKKTTPSELRLVLPTSAKRALIRLPDALDCTTFAKEHRLLHAELDIIAPTRWKFKSLIEAVPMHNCGEMFTIIAYGEFELAPMMFVLRLSKHGEIRWRDYPSLLIQLLGDASDEAKYPPAEFHGWNPSTDKWKVIDPDDDYRPEGSFDFLLLRHKSNERAPGLSRWLDHLKTQKKMPVGTIYSIPTWTYGSPWRTRVKVPPPPMGGSPSALSAHYLRSAYTVHPRPDPTTAHALDDDAMKTLRKSASAPNLQRSALNIKPLEVARSLKRKMTANVHADDETSTVRRSPRNHRSAEESVDASPRNKKTKTMAIASASPLTGPGPTGTKSGCGSTT